MLLRFHVANVVYPCRAVIFIHFWPHYYYVSQYDSYNSRLCSGIVTCVTLARYRSLQKRDKSTMTIVIITAIFLVFNLAFLTHFYSHEVLLRRGYYCSSAKLLLRKVL